MIKGEELIGTIEYLTL